MGLAFQFEFLLLVHHLNDILILNKFSAPIYVLHAKIMEDKIYGLNILIVSVTNLITTYLQLQCNTNFTLTLFTY